jgi:hypothetical protein
MPVEKSAFSELERPYFDDGAMGTYPAREITSLTTWQDTLQGNFGSLHRQICHNISIFYSI